MNNKGITLVALVVTIIVLLILAGVTISAIFGNQSIIEKSAEAKQTSERAEAKELAQMDIMAYTADKIANNQDASLDDSKVKTILTGKSYVKDGQPGNGSFLTEKGEYEIPYSELYTPTEPTSTTKYGLSDDGTVFIGKPANGQNGCNGNVEFADGQKFTSGHFILVENYDGLYPQEDAYFVWDESPYGEITEGSDCFSNCDNFDIYYTDGTFFTSVSL